ncbi:MAG: hypothetical protein IJT58_05895 [Synergistaceae bacterium]|nr:hypothetical protein [Synergistaceae bacterium]
MSENINELYNKIDFLVNGGALKSLTDFLDSKSIHALIVTPPEFESDSDSNSEARSNTLNILEAAGIVPESLTIDDTITRFFAHGIPHESFELDYADGPESGEWPSLVRIRGAHWEIYILLKTKIASPEEFLNELRPYAGLIRLWQTFRKIADTEKKLARLSYMILATKNTLASIFEPMPLQYFASFLTDVLQESLFPKSIAILRDEGSYLTVFNGQADNIPERKGLYSSQILPPTPVITKSDSPVEVVLPVAEGDCRLFCLMHWDELPDDQTMNFLELLGNLAVRAIAINNLRQQSQQAEANISTGEFTVLSLSNVLKVLRGAESQSKFLSLLAEIFVEQGRMQNCLLAVWNKSRKGYTLSEGKTGHIKATLDTTLLPSSSGAVSNEKVSEPYYDLGAKSPDTIFKSWGLAGCPWKEAFKSSSIKYIFPICDDNSLVGIIALGSGQGGRVLDRSQLASLQLIAQFAAYEFRRFEQ